MFQCHSPKSSHPLLLPQSPKVRCKHLCLFCLLSCIQGYHYHLSKFHIYVLVYCIGVFLSGFMVMDRRINIVKNEYTTQSHLTIQCNSYQATSGIFHRTRTNNVKICIVYFFIPVLCFLVSNLLKNNCPL